MNIHIPASLAAVLSLLFATNGFAQTSPIAVDDPESTIVSELVITAPTPGPAWWRVSKGPSVVWIIGLPAAATPRKMAWDKRPLERRLDGAKALLMPPPVPHPSQRRGKRP